MCKTCTSLAWAFSEGLNEDLRRSVNRGDCSDGFTSACATEQRVLLTQHLRRKLHLCCRAATSRFSALNVEVSDRHRAASFACRAKTWLRLGAARSI